MSRQRLKVLRRYSRLGQAVTWVVDLVSGGPLGLDLISDAALARTPNADTELGTLRAAPTQTSSPRATALSPCGGSTSKSPIQMLDEQNVAGPICHRTAPAKNPQPSRQRSGDDISRGSFAKLFAPLVPLLRRI